MAGIADKTHHFDQRCLERGIDTTCLFTLRNGISWAIQRARDDLVELVLTSETGKYWRFRCPDGIFYAVTKPDGHWPVTVVTQEMFRKKRWALKMQKRGKRRGDL